MSAFNSTSGENYIFFDFDNSKCYFSREKHPENTGKSRDTGDIWLSVLDSSWSNPKRLELNDKTFQSPLGFSSDQKYFLYNQVKFDKGLYYGSVLAVNLNSSQEPFEVAIPYFKNRSPLQTGSISSDGRYLLLSLENNLGYGVDDLFVCILKSDGSWSSPRNLGNVVNTRYQELTPFIASDGKTLFFASNGHGGAGSFDVFQSTRLDDTWQNWTAPQNIGKSVNTSGAETSFVFNNDSEFAYFVSTQNSDGYGDIKRIRVQADFEDAQEEPEVINMVVEESNANQIIFELFDSKSNQQLQGEALKITNDDTIRFQSNGSNQIILNDVNGSIVVEFKSKGYFSSKHQFSTEELLTNTEPKAILLSPLESGNVITLEHVLFYRGTANFIEGSQDELDLVVEMMKENQDVEIFLKGHTDNQGNPIMNVQLSQERVLAVTAYLVEHGIEEERITGKGFGGEEPIASNAEESTRKLNRRVEFEVRRDN